MRESAAVTHSGCILTFSRVALTRYEKERGLPHHYINVAITARGKRSAFQVSDRVTKRIGRPFQSHPMRLERILIKRGSTSQRFERNEIDLYKFYELFGTELSDADFNNECYKTYCETRKLRG